MPCVRFKTTCPFTCGGTGNGGPGGGGACDPGGPGGRIGCCEAPLSGGSLASLAGGPPYKFGNCKFATDKSIIRYPNRTCTSTTATNALLSFDDTRLFSINYRCEKSGRHYCSTVFYFDWWANCMLAFIRIINQLR
jgi:hypothetical protein